MEVQKNGIFEPVVLHDRIYQVSKVELGNYLHENYGYTIPGSLTAMAGALLYAASVEIKNLFFNKFAAIAGAALTLYGGFQAFASSFEGIPLQSLWMQMDYNGVASVRVLVVQSPDMGMTGNAPIAMTCRLVIQISSNLKLASEMRVLDVLRNGYLLSVLRTFIYL